MCKCARMCKCAKVCKLAKMCKFAKVCKKAGTVEQLSSDTVSARLAQLNSRAVAQLTVAHVILRRKKIFCTQLRLKNSNENVVPYLNAICAR